MIGKQIYSDQRGIFLIMLITVSLLSISYIPHYSLFVRKQDKAIVLSTLAALVVALACNYLLVPVYGLYGAVYSALAAMTVNIIAKSILAMKFRGVLSSTNDNKIRL